MNEVLPNKEKSLRKLVFVFVGLLLVLGVLVYFIFTSRINLRGLISKNTEVPGNPMGVISDESPFAMMPEEEQENINPATGNVNDLAGLVPSFADPTRVGRYSVNIQNIDFNTGTITLKFADDSTIRDYIPGELVVVRPIVGKNTFKTSSISPDDLGKDAEFVVTPSEGTVSIIITGDSTNE